jgi:hypothetical protein
MRAQCSDWSSTLKSGMLEPITAVRYWSGHAVASLMRRATGGTLDERYATTVRLQNDLPVQAADNLRRLFILFYFIIQKHHSTC